MPPGVKEQLGLSDPKSANKNPTTNTGSTEQADKFKAAFQAASAPINECLQYTAAHAEQTKHDPQASKRDTTCQAYQVALGKIDPTNPSVAQGAIDQVLAGVQGLKSAVETFKAAAEKAFNAWTAKEPELHSARDKIREMVEWGHEKAATLQQIVDGCVAKTNERAYEGALTVLDQLCAKLGPIYEEYLKQKAAKEEYEPALQTLQPRLDKAKACTYKSLATQQQELTSAAEQMTQAADKKDYVTALAQLRTLEGNVGAFETKLAEIEAKKAEYEQARAALDPKLGEASTSKFKSLAELDQQIADLTSRTDAAASEEDYEQAVTLVNELTAKVDEKLAKVVELEAKKAEYETARQTLDPKLGEASTSQYKALAELDQQIADLTSRTDAAASEEDYEQAVTLVGELSTKVDEKIARAKEIEAKKQEYEAARQTLDPKLTEASTSQYKTLAELDQQVADLTTKTDAAVAEEDYEQAVTLVGELSTKVDEKIARAKEIEAKKQEYEAARQALDPKLGEASTSQYKTLAELDQQIVDGTTKTDAAVAEEDYEQAVTLVGELSTKVDEKITKVKELEEKKAQFETARAEVDGKLKGASQEKSDELAALDQEIADLTKQMEEAAAADDYETATTLLQQLSTKVDEKVKLVEAKKEYETAAKAEEANFTSADGTDPADHYELKNSQSSYQTGKKELDALVAAKDYKGALGKLPGVSPLAKAYVDKRKAYDNYKAEETTVKADLDYVSALRNNSPPNGTHNAETTLYTQMINNFHQGNFEQAVKDMKALQAKVADLKKRVEENDKTAKPAAEAAEKEIQKLAGDKKVADLTDAEKAKLVEELKKLTPEKQRKILEDMHGPSSKLTDEQRQIQIAMYKAMDLDGEFKKADTKIREQYQEELQKDEEIKNAMNNWNKKDKDGKPLVDLAEKQKMMEKILATQSKAYGVDVPKIDWFTDAPNKFGSFSADTTRIKLNTVHIDNAKEMIDTIIHENTHNFQDELVKKFVAGKIPKSDPMYEQAKTFAVTHHWDAYVTSDEDGDAYEKQPEEMQAWDAGGKESKTLMDAYKKKPKKTK